MTKNFNPVQQSNKSPHTHLPFFLLSLLFFTLASPIIVGGCDCNTPDRQDAAEKKEAIDAGTEPTSTNYNCPELVGGEMTTLDASLPEDYNPRDTGSQAPDTAVPTCKLTKRLRNVARGTSIAYSQDGTQLFVRYLRQFNVHDTKSLRHLYGFPTTAGTGLDDTSIFTTPSLPLVMLQERYGYALFNTESRSMIRTKYRCFYRRAFEEEGKHPILHRSGRYVIRGKESGVTVRSLYTGKVFHYRSAPLVKYGIGYDPGSDRFAIQDSRKTLKVMNFRGDVVHDITHPNKRVSVPVGYVAFDPSGRYVFTSHKDGLELWDLQKETARAYSSLSPFKIRFHPKGHFFIAATGKRSTSSYFYFEDVYLVRFSDGKVMQKVTNFLSVSDFALSPDGKTIIVLHNKDIDLYTCQ